MADLAVHLSSHWSRCMGWNSKPEGLTASLINIANDLGYKLCWLVWTVTSVLREVAASVLLSMKSKAEATMSYRNVTVSYTTPLRGIFIMGKQLKGFSYVRTGSHLDMSL